ncbi:hypothetical protein [Brevibacillus sp. SYSU BS000544]|uniref:hypothetical protein n=1 Tax=Brevibacillus sp. SYSU BS000544 TaxID=3416443 RepID=UPI003CE49367
MKSDRITYWKRYLVLFVFGMLVGSGLFLFLYGREMEHLMLINRNLDLRNERLEEELLNLRHSQKVARKKQDIQIEEIQVTLLDPRPDAFTEAEVVRLLEKDLAPLKGKKVDQVKEVHLILHEMLYRREYVINGKVTEVRLKTAVISKVLFLSVTVQVKIDI